MPIAAYVKVQLGAYVRVRVSVWGAFVFASGAGGALGKDSMLCTV